MKHRECHFKLCPVNFSAQIKHPGRDRKGGCHLSKEVGWLFLTPAESWCSREVSFGLENGEVWFFPLEKFFYLWKLNDGCSTSWVPRRTEVVMEGWIFQTLNSYSKCKTFVSVSGLPCLSACIMRVFGTDEHFWAGADLGYGSWQEDDSAINCEAWKKGKEII